MIVAALIVAAAVVMSCFIVSASVDNGFKRLVASQEREAQENRAHFDSVRSAGKAYTLEWQDRQRERERAKSSTITYEEAMRRADATRAAGGRVFDG